MRSLRSALPGVLVAGCLALLATSPATAQLTRSQAIQVLEREVSLAPDTPAWSPFVDYGFGPGFEGRLPAGSVLQPAFTNIAPYGGTSVAAQNSYVFLVDDEPNALWGHAVRYVVIDANQPFATATALVLPQGWWMQVLSPGVFGGFVPLDADQEVPAPTAPTGRGEATIVLDTVNQILTVSGTYATLGSNVTAAHIHGPAAAGATAGVLYALTQTGLRSGSMSGQFDYGATPPPGMTPAQFEAAVLGGNTYINVHTVNNGPGEIRGQINVGAEQEFFKERVTALPPGGLNTDGQVRGTATAPGLFKTGLLAAPEPNLDDFDRILIEEAQKFRGDPCAILFSGDASNTFNDDVDRFKKQMEDRGMPASRLKVKKNGKLSDLTAMVAQLCSLNVKCDKIYVYIGAHGGNNSLGFQGATAAERNVTEKELVNALCPLAGKDAKLCIIIQACHSGSLTDGLGGKLKGASIFTSSSATLTSYGTTYYDKPTGTPGRKCLGRFSVFSNAFSNCWDSLAADKNSPKNGVDWEEAWKWVCAKNDTVYDSSDDPDWPKERNPQHPKPSVSGSIWVNSFTCRPGEAVNIQVHGTVRPPNKPVTWCIENGRTGLKANTPVGGTDSIDLDSLDTAPRTAEVTPEGKFWDTVTVVCPPTAQAGQSAVYKVKVKVDGNTVDVDYGCVNVIAPAPVPQQELPRIEPMPASQETDAGLPTSAVYRVVNTSGAPKNFAFIATALNHFDSANGFLDPVEGVATADSGIGTGQLFGTLQPLAPVDSVDVVIEVIPDPAFGPISGLTVDLALFDITQPTGLGVNASVTVLAGPTTVDVPGTPPATRFFVSQNRPNPFNPATVILYSLEAPADVVLRIYDARGRLVQALTRRGQAPGEHRFTWNGRDRLGRPVGSGTYFYRLQAGAEVATRKMTLVR